MAKWSLCHQRQNRVQPWRIRENLKPLDLPLRGTKLNEEYHGHADCISSPRRTSENYFLRAFPAPVSIVF